MAEYSCTVFRSWDHTKEPLVGEIEAITRDGINNQLKWLKEEAEKVFGADPEIRLCWVLKVEVDGFHTPLGLELRRGRGESQQLLGIVVNPKSVELYGIFELIQRFKRGLHRVRQMESSSREEFVIAYLSNSKLGDPEEQNELFLIGVDEY